MVLAAVWAQEIFDRVHRDLYSFIVLVRGSHESRNDPDRACDPGSRRRRLATSFTSNSARELPSGKTWKTPTTSQRPSPADSMVWGWGYWRCGWDVCRSSSTRDRRMIGSERHGFA